MPQVGGRSRPHIAVTEGIVLSCAALSDLEQRSQLTGRTAEWPAATGQVKQNQ
jgi:hypothetical protein